MMLLLVVLTLGMSTVGWQRVLLLLRMRNSSSKGDDTAVAPTPGVGRLLLRMQKMELMLLLRWFVPTNRVRV